MEGENRSKTKTTEGITFPLPKDELAAASNCKRAVGLGLVMHKTGYHPHMRSPSAYIYCSKTHETKCERTMIR